MRRFIGCGAVPRRERTPRALISFSHPPAGRRRTFGAPRWRPLDLSNQSQARLDLTGSGAAGGAGGASLAPLAPPATSAAAIKRALTERELADFELLVGGGIRRFAPMSTERCTKNALRTVARCERTSNRSRCDRGRARWRNRPLRKHRALCRRPRREPSSCGEKRRRTH